jgi:hypothetical protein
MSLFSNRSYVAHRNPRRLLRIVAIHRIIAEPSAELLPRSKTVPRLVSAANPRGGPEILIR